MTWQDIVDKVLSSDAPNALEEKEVKEALLEGWQEFLEECALGELGCR